MRTTSDPQDEKLKLRLNKELKSHAEKSASEDGVTISEYIRGLLRQDVINRRNRKSR